MMGPIGVTGGLMSSFDSFNTTILGRNGPGVNTSANYSQITNVNAELRQGGVSTVVVGFGVGQTGNTMTNQTIVGYSASPIPSPQQDNTIIGSLAFQSPSLVNTYLSESVLIGYAVANNSSFSSMGFGVAIGYKTSAGTTTESETDIYLGAFTNVISRGTWYGTLVGYNSQADFYAGGVSQFITAIGYGATTTHKTFTLGNSSHTAMCTPIPGPVRVPGGTPPLGAIFMTGTNPTSAIMFRVV
jgi:hypothetical protein